MRPLGVLSSASLGRRREKFIKFVFDELFSGGGRGGFGWHHVRVYHE